MVIAVASVELGPDALGADGCGDFSRINFVEQARKMATALIETADETRAVAMI